MIKLIVLKIQVGTNMPLLKIMIAFAILTMSVTTFAKECDQECWQKRQYELQKQMILNQQRQLNHQIKQEEIARKKQEIKEKKEREIKKQKLLKEIHQRCNTEDLNEASFEEKSLCGLVKGHFEYGLEVPDSKLGLE